MRKEKMQFLRANDGEKMKDSELELKDLLTVIPTLRKHNAQVAIHKRVRQLRAGRTQKAWTIEISRKPEERGLKIETKLDEKGMVISRKSTLAPLIMASAPISRKVLDTKQGKIELLRKLKNKITSQVKESRKASLPPIETYTFREGVKVRKLAEVYLDQEIFLALSNKRVRLNMKNGKSPTTKEHHIGVEIEFASKQNIEQVCDALFEAGLGKHIHAKRDGSISQPPGHPNQVEIAVIAKQSEIKDVIKKVCDVLNNKLNIVIDKTCGLHVHLDMRNRKVENCYANLIYMQRYLYSMSPAARKKQSVRAGGRVTEGFSAPIESAKFHVPEEHYWGVNALTYRKFQTIEVRMHSGSSQARKINNFISFLTAIVDAKPLTGTPDDMEAVQKALGLSDTLTDYINSRIAKFAPQHKKTPNPKWMGDVKPVGKADTSEPEDSEVA
jgi:hypothetical protein